MDTNVNFQKWYDFDQGDTNRAVNVPYTPLQPFNSTQHELTELHDHGLA